ncbi:MAG: PorV/PorQ family protein [Candidatus Latescibacteria bacterium]|nr:PorV/PorQ family protein [Candidatus Latescibacterota bacterium]NIO01058.1 PorV/PorQ family protein [Candidatus Latescibacterota bacterium]NIO27457.1 PorV/PorQ family protein [Candidatus Latescibacterota bacterium]NIO54979.1 PorV/PorQ family protein [Candidatus Latescibacterota bacterium]NIT01068.1 PorV/PorQ family protein [Candidatus Latescibacterota bacterium]
MKRLFVSITLLLVILAGFAQAQTSDRAGSVGALFLKLGMSPRAAAMGNTYLGLSDDISGIFLNPVSIVGLEGYQFYFSELEYMVDMRAFAGAISFPIWERIGGRAAIHYTGYYSGEMTMTTESDIDGTLTNRKFTWNELALGVTYARAFTDKFAIGGGVKYVRTDVADFYSYTVAFDVGTLYKTGFRNLRIGMSATNFGPDMKFKGNYGNTYISSIWQVNVPEEFGYYPLPIAFQVGIADELYTAEDFRVTGAIDYSHPNDLAERIHVGAEFAYDEMVFVRGGIFMDMDKSDIVDPIDPGDDALDRYWEFRFGAGFQFSNVTVDYAWQDVENLESVHRFALAFKL